MSREQMDAVADRIALISSEIDAATHELLTQLRAFDEASGWYYQGALSCAHWLSWRTGLTMGPAREKVRVAKKLGELQEIDEELRCGRLSYSKARALTRAATLENEHQLLEIARHSTASQLEKICRLYRSQTQSKPSSAEDSEERRWVTSRGTDDDMVRIEAQLRPDEAAIVMKAIEQVAIESSAETRRVDRAGALLAMAERFLAGDGEGRLAVEVLLKVEASTLAGRDDDLGELAGTLVSAETCRRLACDAAVVPVVVDAGGNVLDVGRKTRKVGKGLRRALTARDDGCRFPGCDNCLFVDAHHIVHWGQGGDTEIENLVTLCSHHHRFVHEYNYRVERTAGGFVFLKPDGTSVDAVRVSTPSPGAWASFVRTHRTTPNMGIALSYTTEPDYDLA